MLIGPRLCFCEEDSKTFLTGNGNQIEQYAYNGSDSSGQFMECKRYRVFCERKNTIHQLFNYNDIIFYAGENVIGFLSKTDKFKSVHFCFRQWITKFKLMVNEVEQCWAKSFRRVGIYGWNNMEGFTRLCWHNERKYIFVSTIGAIFCYDSLHRAHRSFLGPVFDLKVATNLSRYILYSVGDDRSLKAWDISDICLKERNADKAICSTNLCDVYGHSARVYCLEVDLKYGQGIFTGAEDRTICIWRWQNSESNIICDDRSKMVLFNRITLDVCGSIRSMHVVDNCLVACSNNGALMSVRLHSHTTIEVPALPKIKSKILSFCCSNDGSIIFFIDERRTLYKWEKRKQLLTSILGEGTINVNETSKTEMLVMFDFFVIVASGNSLYVVKIYEDGYEQYPLNSIPISIVQLKYEENEFLLVTLVNGQCIIFEIPQTYCSSPTQSSFLIERSQFMLRPKTVVMCAMFLNDETVVLGTRSGVILLVSLSSHTILHVITKAHLGESVSAFFKDEYDKNCSFNSLGRDGYNRSWNYDGQQLRLMLGNFIMEAPIRTHYIQKQRFVCGFFGNYLLVLDVSTNTIISRYICGGGNRIWQIVLKSKCTRQNRVETDFYFYFLSKGRLRAVQLKLFTVQILQAALISSNVSCLKHCDDVTTFEHHRNHNIFNGGIDGRLTTFCFNNSLLRNSEHSNILKSEITSRYILKQISSIFDLDSILIKKHTKNSSDLANIRYTAVGSGRSEITLLLEQMNNETDDKLNTSALTRILFSKRLLGPDDSRIIAVRIKEDDKGNLWIYVICSDGSFRSISINADLCSIDEKQSIYIPHSLSMFWKFEILDRHLYLISTCGRLFCYDRRTNTEEYRFELLAELQIEYNGLSSLAIFADDSDTKTAFICVGSESGNLTIVEHCASHSNNLKTICTQIVHSATITAVNCVQSNSNDYIYIICTSLDCRISIFNFYFRSTKKISFVNSLCLTISDPSSMISFTNNNEPKKIVCLVAGNGVETVEFNISNTQN